MICASEQAVIVDQEIYATVRAEMEALGCYFCTPEEKQRLESLVIKTDTCAVNADIVGKPATWIAEKAGIDVPETTVMLVAELEHVGAAEPLSHEKTQSRPRCVPRRFDRRSVHDCRTDA